jgi:glycerol kinase
LGKNTYGTAGVLQVNTGTDPLFKDGLTTTIAWGINGRVEYALEGVVFTAGATIQWLRDELGIVKQSADTEYFASQVDDTGGVYLVPAFTGLCAPHWDMYARGLIVGITRGTNYKHIIRAGIESMAFQTKDIIETAMGRGGVGFKELRVDGGAVQNNLLCQFQADILGISIVRPKITEMTALGAAYLAGLGVGFWESQEEIARQWEVDNIYTPSMSRDRAEELYSGWKKAVDRSRAWVCE